MSEVCEIFCKPIDACTLQLSLKGSRLAWIAEMPDQKLVHRLSIEALRLDERRLFEIGLELLCLTAGAVEARIGAHLYAPTRRGGCCADTARRCNGPCGAGWSGVPPAWSG